MIIMTNSANFIKPAKQKKPPTHAQKRQRLIAKLLRLATSIPASCGPLKHETSRAAEIENSPVQPCFHQVVADLERLQQAADKLKRTLQVANERAKLQTLLERVDGQMSLLDSKNSSAEK